MSPEEEQYYKMETLRARNAPPSRDGEVKGVEFGLDESALYEMPQERWKRSGYREKKKRKGGKECEGKTWRRYEDLKKRDTEEEDGGDTQRYNSEDFNFGG